MFRKKVIDYCKNPEMLSKFTSQNGIISSFKNTNKPI
jgi:ribosomal protein S18